MTYDRETLIGICEKAFVLQDKWGDRDSSSAQRKLGECYALLRAGCKFEILTADNDGKKHGMVTDERTIWLEITFKGFRHFDWCDEDDCLDRETFYLPTAARLDNVNGGDWY